MIWWIESARGGAGKSRLCLALAREAAEQGKRVTLCDLTGKARTLDAALGVADAVALTLTDVYAGEAALTEALYSAPDGSGVQYALASFDQAFAPGELRQELEASAYACDLAICEVPTGCCGFAAEGGSRALLLTGEDELSLRAADRLLHGASGEQPEVVLLTSGDKKTERQALLAMEADWGMTPLAILRPEKRLFGAPALTQEAFAKAAKTLIADTLR